MTFNIIYFFQLLEEICQKNGWGSPNFQLHSTVTRDGSGDAQLFLYKVRLQFESCMDPEGGGGDQGSRHPP